MELSSHDIAMDGLSCCQFLPASTVASLDTVFATFVSYTELLKGQVAEYTSSFALALKSIVLAVADAGSLRSLRGPILGGSAKLVCTSECPL